MIMNIVIIRTFQSCCEINPFKLSLRKSILMKEDSPELNRNVSPTLLVLFN